MTFAAVGIPVLSLFILALVFSVYLASLRSSHRATHYLLGAYVLQVAWAGSVLLHFQFGPSPVIEAAQLIIGTFVYWTTLQFCYTFLEQPFGREYDRAWWISLAVTTVAVAAGAVAGLEALVMLTVATMTLIALWALAVLVRKAVRLTRREDPSASVPGALLRTQVRAARAQRAVLVPVAIALSVIVLYAFVQAGAVSGVVYNAWLRIGLLVGLVFFALIQFTYGRERHSVQIKLVGMALTIVLSVLAFVSMIVIEPIEGPGPSVLAWRMALVIVGASGVTIAAFPLAYRSSLTGPIDRLLRGIRRVDEGDLEVEVPVLVNDEVGELTRSFNRMTASLREYAHRMEALVAGRTAELKASQARLVQQEKLASLGALTAGIAHEIKNPLNFVNNFAGLAAELTRELRESLKAQPGASSPDVELLLEDLDQNAAKVVEHGRRADGIVRSMLMHSRGSSAPPETVDLNALVREYAHLAYHGMRARNSDFHCELVWELEEGLPPVEAVPQDMGRVVLNVVNNAFQAVTSAPGANGKKTPEVTFMTRSLGERVEIRVADTGPGVSEDVRRRIFEPFFTTKPTGEGTGLGLSMSHDIIVQGHGGSMWVESEEGSGATFVISVPLRRSAEPRAEPASPHLGST